MHYTHIELDRYLPFTFSGIEKLILQLTAPTQIIIGANGSGKSSLLREISPLPAVRTDYGANGYKKLLLTHRGHQYQLVSDFSNRSAPHSFHCDGQELNAGGTTQVQEDLVRSHLGYTKQIEALVTGQYRLAAMPAGMRKTLLMEISPFNLGFLHERQKTVRAAIRACKNNLTRLHERKLTLEAELLPETTMQQLTDERQQLDRELTQIVEYIHRIDEVLRGLDAVKSEETDLHPQHDYSALTKQIRQAMEEWRQVSRDAPQEQLTQLQEQVQQAAAVLPHLETQIVALTEEIDNYRAKLEEIAEKQSQGDLRQEIETLKVEITKLEPQCIAHPFPEYAMPDLPAILEDLQAQTQVFLGCQTRLLSQRQMQRKQLLLDRRWQQARALQDERTRLQTRQHELQTRSKIVKSDIPEQNCAQMACPLYRVFMTQTERTQQELTVLEQQLATLETRLRRLTIYTTGVQAQLAAMRQYMLPLRRLSEVFRDHPYLKAAVPDFDLLPLLQNTPMALYRHIADHHQGSQATHLQRQLKQSLEEKLLTVARLQDLDLDELDFLQTVLQEKQTNLTALRTQAQQQVTQLQQLRRQRDQVTAYLESLAALQTAETQLKTQLEIETQCYERTLLTQIRQLLETARTEHVQRIGTIDHQCRAQDILHSRYGEEVVGQIGLIEVERAELQQLDFALHGIPHRYTVAFLNALIALMNEAIALVFSYPLELLPLDEAAPLDYQFRTRIGDVIIPDISRGSEAQQEMINLAFMLAVMQQRQLAEYPIFLDEAGKSFDAHHKQSLLYLFQAILEREAVSSLFLVNHNDTIINGLANAETLVLNELNIVLPSQYNTHAEILRV